MDYSKATLNITTQNAVDIRNAFTKAWDVIVETRAKKLDIFDHLPVELKAKFEQERNSRYMNSQINALTELFNSLTAIIDGQPATWSSPLFTSEITDNLVKKFDTISILSAILTTHVNYYGDNDRFVMATYAYIDGYINVTGVTREIPK